MFCKIDDRDVPLGYVIDRDFGWGSEIPPADRHTYELVIPTDEVASVLAVPYDEFSVEMKADDKLDGEPAIQRMQKLGYPAFERVFPGEPALLVEAVREYLYDDVFEAAFSNSGEAYRYALNSITSVELTRNGLMIRGDAANARPIPGVG